MATVIEIQNGGDRHIELLQLCTSNVIDVFQVGAQCFH